MLQLLNKLFHSIKIVFPEWKMRQLIEPNSRHYLPSNRGLNWIQLHTHTSHTEWDRKWLRGTWAHNTKIKERKMEATRGFSYCDSWSMFFFLVPIDFSMHWTEIRDLRLQFGCYRQRHNTNKSLRLMELRCRDYPCWN